MYKLTLVVLMSVVLSAYANRVRQLSGYGSSYETVKPPMAPAPVQQYSSYGSSNGLQTSFVSEPNPCFGRLAGDKLVYSLSSTKYIHCEEEGEWKIMDCPSLLVFNPETLRCENTLRTPKGCLSNPCLNGGRCVDLPLFQWRCDCPTGFAGDFCEKTDGCLVDSCGATGICFPLPAGSPISKYCLSADLAIVGVDLLVSFESNPCLTNEMELKTFPSKSNSAVFIHCEGNIPHLKFCQYPLIYNHQIQDCDWSEPQEQGRITLEAPSNNYGYSQIQITEPAPSNYGYSQQKIAEPAPVPVPVPTPAPTNYGYSQVQVQPAPGPIRRTPEPVQEQSYGYGQKIETPAPVLIRETPVAQPSYGQQVFKPAVRQPARQRVQLKQTLKSSGY